MSYEYTNVRECANDHIANAIACHVFTRETSYTFYQNARDAIIDDDMIAMQRACNAYIAIRRENNNDLCCEMFHTIVCDAITHINDRDDVAQYFEYYDAILIDFMRVE